MSENRHFPDEVARPARADEFIIQKDIDAPLNQIDQQVDILIFGCQNGSGRAVNPCAHIQKAACICFGQRRQAGVYELHFFDAKPCAPFDEPFAGNLDDVDRNQQRFPENPDRILEPDRVIGIATNADAITKRRSQVIERIIIEMTSSRYDKCPTIPPGDSADSNVSSKNNPPWRYATLAGCVIQLLHVVKVRSLKGAWPVNAGHASLGTGQR